MKPDPPKTVTNPLLMPDASCRPPLQAPRLPDSVAFDHRNLAPVHAACAARAAGPSGPHQAGSLQQLARPDHALQLVLAGPVALVRIGVETPHIFGIARPDLRRRGVRLQVEFAQRPHLQAGAVLGDIGFGGWHVVQIEESASGPTTRIVHLRAALAADRAAAETPGPLVPIAFRAHEGRGLCLAHAFEEIEPAIVLGDVLLAEKMPPFAIPARCRMGPFEIAALLITHARLLGARTRRLVRGRFHAYILELNAVAEGIAVG